jgi:tRNA threonylcarbamoyladenosine biosynthesis protein TsaB
VGSVALVSRQKVIVSRYFDIDLQHSKRLFVEIEGVCSEAAIEIAELEAVAVTIGPGSFTGLRIGLAAAKGLCMPSDKALVGVSTLAVLAARVPYARMPVCALLDARKGQVYAGLYDTSQGVPVVLTGPVAADPVVLLQERAGQDTIYTGDGVDAYAELIDAAQGAHRVPLHCARPHASAVGSLAWGQLERGDLIDLATAEPDYLRAPDAKISTKSLLLD